MVFVDENCIWCGICASIASNIFEMGDDWLSHVIKQPETQEEHDSVDEAIAACPVAAIHKEK